MSWTADFCTGETQANPCQREYARGPSSRRIVGDAKAIVMLTSSTSTVRSDFIVVVDDDDGVLRSVARLLSARGFAARTYSSAEHLLLEIEKVTPACVIADLAMPGIDGLELQKTLAASGFAIPFVFITAHHDVRASVQAMRGGAIDFLLKPYAKEEFYDAVERALARNRAIRDERQRNALVHQRLMSLTAREREVFRLIIDGLLNKQISAALGIAERTVKVHRTHIMRKMGVRSVATLARIAERLGVSASGEIRRAT